MIKRTFGHKIGLAHYVNGLRKHNYDEDEILEALENEVIKAEHNIRELSKKGV